MIAFFYLFSTVAPVVAVIALHTVEKKVAVYPAVILLCASHCNSFIFIYCIYYYCSSFFVSTLGTKCKTVAAGTVK